ncbi:MAG: GNAT family N-acetyltransferase [Acidimicrobiia bacterium]|nr:GNAT family N-acetyltransferase [Acidimicrobiia bacterium]
MHTIVERGLASSWTRQVRWTPSGTIHHVGGLVVALSGVADQTQQVAVVDGPVPDPEAAVVAAEVLFTAAGWTPALDLVAKAHPHLEEVLLARGYRMVVERPGMVRQCVDADSTAAAGAVASDTVIRIAHHTDRSSVVGVQCDAFGVHHRIADALMPAAAFDDPGAVVLVADHHGEVVGAVTVHVDGLVAGIVGAGVLPSHQRRGVGRALTDAAVATAAARGAASVWLQATEAGLPVYLRCGFRTVGPCQVWLRANPG